MTATVSDWRPLRVVDAIATTGEKATCERCKTRLRWVHLLENDRNEITSVGCCCAAKLCSEYDATGAVRGAINRGARLLRFIDSGKWKQSRTNASNVWRAVRMPDGSTHRVTVYLNRGRYGVFVAVPRGNHITPFERFDSREAAKRFAFALVDAQSG